MSAQIVELHNGQQNNYQVRVLTVPGRDLYRYGPFTSRISAHVWAVNEVKGHDWIVVPSEKMTVVEC